MKKKLLFALVLLLMAAALPISASAELGIKPVADPWDDPNIFGILLKFKQSWKKRCC